jgi:hypothetical protein
VSKRIVSDLLTFVMSMLRFVSQTNGVKVLLEISWNPLQTITTSALHLLRLQLLLMLAIHLSLRHIYVNRKNVEPLLFGKVLPNCVLYLDGESRVLIIITGLLSLTNGQKRLPTSST